VLPTLEMFHEYKIFIGKEEGETSQVNQPYDQATAKEDKQQIYELLDSIHFQLKSMITQWELIGVCVHALKKVSSESWVSSFIKVNLHPDHCTSFSEWL
jgi:hypothetical protein